jgi:hypothetical protein
MDSVFILIFLSVMFIKGMINILKKNDFFNDEIENQNFMNFIMNGLSLFKKIINNILKMIIYLKNILLFLMMIMIIVIMKIMIIIT